MRADGETVIKAKKSRNHTELLSEYLNLPIKIDKKKNYDLIKIKQVKKTFIISSKANKKYLIHETTCRNSYSLLQSKWTN